jgi:hypothetical protein
MSKVGELQRQQTGRTNAQLECKIPLLHLLSITDEKASTPPEVLPRDFFDYVFGTSSGGWVLFSYAFFSSRILLNMRRLLAIMLGRLRMPLSDTKAAFERYSRNVFNHRSILSYFWFLGAPYSPRYSTRRITKAIKELVEEKQLDPSRPWIQNFFASEGDPCRT